MEIKFSNEGTINKNSVFMAHNRKSIKLYFSSKSKFDTVLELVFLACLILMVFSPDKLDKIIFLGLAVLTKTQQIEGRL